MRSSFLIFTILLIALTACKSGNVHLASDAKSGQYLGVVQNEVRDFESKEIVYYEISNGENTLRKTPQEVSIYEP